MNNPTGSKVRNPIAGDVPVADIITPMVREGELYRALPDNKVRCVACAHECLIKDGARGICQVRYNVGGKLYVPFDYVAALQCDPTEKKPFFHVNPGSDTLTFGMLGCNLHCNYCQNWDISQTLRDANAGRPPQTISPAELVRMAKRNGAKNVASSYNEPLITSEWARAVFEPAKASGLVCGYVSSGNATREVLEYLRPYTDAYKVDLKTMRDKSYRTLGTVLQHVLDTIHMAHQMGFWLEVVTLIVPGFNDSEDELRDAAQFLAGISPDIPWHVTAFHADYRMQGTPDTEARQLMRAVDIGYAAGLRYVYAGNRAGQVGNCEDTRCPSCQKTLIQRYAYVILDYQITAQGTCPDCGTSIAGIFPDNPAEVCIGTRSDVFSRRPRAVR